MIWEGGMVTSFHLHLKCWFVSIIRSGNMLTIQRICISKPISRCRGSVGIMWCSASHTPHTARHHSFIKLKFIRNVCLSCGTLVEQVTRNPRFYCIFFFIQANYSCSDTVIPTRSFLWWVTKHTETQMTQLITHVKCIKQQKKMSLRSLILFR